MKYPVYAAVFQLTSARTMKAFLVVLLAITAVTLVLMGREIPDVVSNIILLIVGYYFKESEDIPTRENGSTEEE